MNGTIIYNMVGCYCIVRDTELISDSNAVRDQLGFKPKSQMLLPQSYLAIWLEGIWSQPPPIRTRH